MSNDAGRDASIETSRTSRFPIVRPPSLRERVGDWIFPPKGPEIGPVTLGQRRVYILPTGGGLMFGVTILLMLVGSINYNLTIR